MSRIEREKHTVRKMIERYCRHHLNQDTMPEEYQLLADYACQRLDLCQCTPQLHQTGQHRGKGLLGRQADRMITTIWQE